MSEKRFSFSQLFYALFGFEKARNWKSRLLIILIHIAGWLILFLLPLLFYPFRIADNRFFISQLIDKSLLVGFFYLNYYVLIPKFFEHKKKTTYFLIVVLCFVTYLVPHILQRTIYGPLPMGRALFIDRQTGPVSAADSMRIKRIIELRSQLERDSLIPPPPFGDRQPNGERMPIPMRTGFVLRILSSAGSSFLLVFLMGGFIRLTYSFIRNQNEKKALENANLNAELNFLRSQINPHFLFNTLNGIYAQAHEKSEQTEHTVLKLSELLRYVIYDSGEEMVPLSKDIQYINNYVDLQLIRLSSKVIINYNVQGELEGYMIAPLLLISFIENAFKHGISYSKSSVIDIRIDVFDKRLTLLVRNPVAASNSFAGGGLGLKNVKRRLELLYPGNYDLDIQQDDREYSVRLNLTLKHD